ncbi:SAV_2336 N-terminal domain-related protein [Streptomyces kronopolitis]|uniref:SAV_2336 N-terminal domain-related protein n=1 Tax=Streptomyces kronopolitis TaxID=1612435 RepID=UPI0036BA7E87
MLPEPLAKALGDGGIDISAEELLDVLWLAAHLPRDSTAPLVRAGADREASGDTHALVAAERHGEGAGHRSTKASRPGASSSPPPEYAGTDRTDRATARPRRPVSSGGGLHAAEAQGPQSSLPAIPLRVPEEKVLASEELALSRALRPLKRSRPNPRAWELDERATVATAAETSLLDPVMRPVRTRWLDLVMLVDDGVSMLLWRRLVTEVRQLLERSGAFRTVRIHGLDTRGPSAPRVASRPYLGDDRDSAPAVNASDAGAASTLLLVLSDGVGAAWQDERMHAFLGRMARQGPTAVMHTLPESLRASSGIRHRKWQVTTRRAGAANHTWEIRDPILPTELAPFSGLPVPVIEPSAPVVERWARLVGCAGSTEELPLLAPVSPAPLAPPARSAGELPDPGHDVLRFRAAVGPEAYRLAAHVAAVAPVTVPVMRLIQKGLGEDIGANHLAEVFLGGLMRRTDQGGTTTPPEHRTFDFPEDIRRILLSTVPADELLRTSQALNSRLYKLSGRAPGFAAWLAHDQGTGRIGARGRPFTVTDERLLRRLGLSVAPAPEPSDSATRARNTDLPAFIDRLGSPWTFLQSGDPRALGPFTLLARSTTVHGHVVQFLSSPKTSGGLSRSPTLLRVPSSGDAVTDRELARTEADALVRLIGLGAPMLLRHAESDQPWLAVDTGTTGESPAPASDLATLLRNNWRPSEARAAWIGAKLAAGLAHAHGKQVVHGSLAPDRIALAANDVLIMDWSTATLDGVASRHRAADSPDATLLAPELRHDPSAEPTEASDVYALGAVLLAMLTGPFTANARLSAKQVIVPDTVVGGLRRVLEECLDRDPRVRPSASRVSRVFRARLNETGPEITGDVLLAAALPDPKRVTASPGTSNLPPMGLCLGRADELAWLRRALTGLREGAITQSSTVQGLGGVGKSTLALHYAHRHRGDYGLIWWIRAMSPDSIEQSLTGLTSMLVPDWAATADPESQAAWAMQWLDWHSGWLLIYDNVEDPADLSPYTGSLHGGHHLATTRRTRGWPDDAPQLVLGTLDFDEASDLLCTLAFKDTVPTLRQRTEARLLAAELGCLPLALKQAGAYLAQNRSVTLDGYRRQLGSNLDKAARDIPAERTIARVWDITLHTLAHIDPLAVDTLYTAAWLAPDIAHSLLTPPGTNPGTLAEALGTLAAYSMITDTGTTITVHRLVQIALRTPQDPEDQRSEHGRERAEQALIRALESPADQDSVNENWWDAQIPHLLALATTVPTGHHNHPLIEAYEAAAQHLHQNGHTARAVPLYEATLVQREEVLGDMHPDTLTSRDNLAHAYRSAGDLGRAVPLYEATLVQREEILGDMHPDTLTSRDNLAAVRQATSVVQHGSSATITGHLTPFNARQKPK